MYDTWIINKGCLVLPFNYFVNYCFFFFFKKLKMLCCNIWWELWQTCIHTLLCMTHPCRPVLFTKCCASQVLRQAPYGFIDWQDDWKLPALKHWVGPVDLSLGRRRGLWWHTQEEQAIRTQSQCNRVQQHRESDGVSAHWRGGERSGGWWWRWWSSMIFCITFDSSGKLSVWLVTTSYHCW